MVDQARLEAFRVEVGPLLVRLAGGDTLLHAFVRFAEVFAGVEAASTAGGEVVSGPAEFSAFGATSSDDVPAGADDYVSEAEEHSDVEPSPHEEPGKL